MENSEKFKRIVAKHLVGSSVKCLDHRKQLTNGESITFMYGNSYSASRKFTLVPEGNSLKLKTGKNTFEHVVNFTPYDSIDEEYSEAFNKTLTEDGFAIDEDLMDRYFERFED
ncbi:MULTISPECIES: hypothetical protein [Vibrio]|uniref:hypothetical protein n=1 Tax=Vibrio TaxID=662 RepID=UPI0005712DCD|nr:MULTISPECIES: hypothetical protein [Vibrio]EJG0765921.1 hypothetical protein [Vibrio parahaemolyticus O5:K30]MCA2471604.1 hypothetical protein [Vibrio alginolyticus]TVN07035.1 hypothetical protein FPV63_07040 [Vibrio cholerae]EGR2220116.1 hypothetical protein [Vibrio parahaemolyticus]MBE4202629.1 hypothetical protein [Vibrio parahaemolyticus]